MDFDQALLVEVMEKGKYILLAFGLLDIVPRPQTLLRTTARP